MTIPATYIGIDDAELAAAIDAVFSDALAADVAAGIADRPLLSAPASRTAHPLVTLPTNDLVDQVGIAAGPCPPDPRTPSPTIQYAKAGTRVAGRVTWWLVKGSIYVTAIVVRELTSAVWELITNKPAPQPQLESAPVQPMRPSDFLLKTSEHLRDRGWTQFRLEDSRGLCVIGAERSLIGDGVGSREIAERANEHLLAVVRGWSVPSWNDRLSRREDQVHEALRAAAGRARAAGE
ncbi:hypothetical protein [Streptomyces sp. MP131-18]|uniref:DUF6197 family protein n=1 Tax=Streptomyces sp. MP131-18 TaxID=1857892 RepID=UPI00097C7BEC|nr:hypothetical protein [Streptomyces sp. MP131-18]ONK09279.1 hypothetical protein STBA_71340 [Streptomyces sp. MP131-18]